MSLRNLAAAPQAPLLAAQNAVMPKLIAAVQCLFLPHWSMACRTPKLLSIPSCHRTCWFGRIITAPARKRLFCRRLKLLDQTATACRVYREGITLDFFNYQIKIMKLFYITAAVLLFAAAPIAKTMNVGKAQMCCDCCSNGKCDCATCTCCDCSQCPACARK